MARSPRGGSRGPDVRGTLGSLIKSTLAQAGVVRDVIERGAREGRSRLDEARAGRRRHDALAELGEVMLDLIRRGEIDLGELPEVRDVVADLDELDAASQPRSGRSAWGRRDAHGEDDDADGHRLPDREDDDDRHAHGLGAIAMPGSRKRFDDRGGDGTVSSGARRTASGPVAAAAAPGSRVWRPPVVEAKLPRSMPHPHKGGGITFDDDDLADYMHPDDVPPKPASPPDDES